MTDFLHRNFTYKDFGFFIYIICFCIDNITLDFHNYGYKIVSYDT